MIGRSGLTGVAGDGHCRLGFGSGADRGNPHKAQCARTQIAAAFTLSLNFRDLFRQPKRALRTLRLCVLPHKTGI